MLAQWVSWAARQHFREARTEPLITLGSAPLHVPEFRAVLLGQVGEQRLDVAIAADVAGDTAHARALDVDAAGPLRDIHRRAALDEDTEIRPAIRKLVAQEFARGASLPIISFPEDGASIQE